MELKQPIILGRGHWRLAAYEGDHEDYTGLVPLWEWEGHNIITTTGKGLLLDRLFATGGPPAAVGSIGVGTDSTAAAVGQTQLNPSVAGSVLIETADTPAVRAGLVTTLSTTFDTSQANFTWNEVGAFNGNVNGTSVMLSRVVLGTPVSKTINISVIVTFNFTQS